MDPNQQPAQNPQPQQPGQPLPQPQPYAQPLPQPTPQAAQPAQQPQYTPQPIPQPTAPQAPTSYNPTTAPAYDPNYLDSIAPPPAAPKFFSGSFAKIFFGMLILFFVAVSIIVAFSGKDKTADLQQLAVRLDNFSKLTKSEQTFFKSNNLSTTNSNFQTWINGTQAGSQTLLDQGGIKRSQYDKKMVASEKTIVTDLTSKLDDARLNAQLDRVYASTMASESQKFINMLNTMSRKSASKKIRDFAKQAAANLVITQKAFDSYKNDGN